jgi:uncharacterized protein
MIINLEKLKKGKNEFHENLRERDLDLGEVDFHLINDLKADIVALKSKNNVELRISLDYTLQMTCSRCLEVFERNFSEDGIYYLKAGEEPLEEEKFLLEEDIYTLYYAIPEVDTVPLIRELLLLSLPMKPLCSPDCKGLCPVCGANLNKKNCNHNQEKRDPRWAKLMEIKSLKGKKGG